MKWPTAPLEALKSSSRYSFVGGPFGSELTTRDYVADGVPVIRGNNLSGPGKFHDDDYVYVGEKKAKALQSNLASPGDLVFTQRGTLGQVGLIPADAKFEKYVISQSQMKLTVDENKANPLFLYYFFKMPSTIQQIVNRVSSSGVPHINLSVLKAFEVPAPDKDIQDSIVEFVRHYDDLIENNRRRVEVLEEMARAIYREWFVRFRYPGYENIPLVDSTLRPIPVGWSIGSLGELSVNHDRRRRPLSKVQRQERSGTIPYYGAAKLIDWVDGWIFDGEFLLFAEDGSVQTQDGFPVLQLVEGKFWANNHTHILEGSKVSTRFLYLASAEQPITGYVTGAAQPKITQANLNRIPLVVAAHAVQCAFDDVINPIFDEWQLIQKANAPLMGLRDLLLPKLVTGQIDVSHLDLGALTEAATA